MPTPDDVRRALALATSPDALDFFYESLSSADWIPALRETGLLADPPQPIDQESGIAFPGWGLSRYLVRVAPLEPRLVADALADIEATPNPRIQRDIVDALVQMPADYAVRFVPAISRWIHDPYRLGVARSSGALAERLTAAGEMQAAVQLIRSMAELVPPETAAGDLRWLPIDDYDYRELVPQLAVQASVFGLELPYVLADELQRHLAKNFEGTETEPARDLSFIWRPAIEDHEQNQDFDLQAHLLVAIRDAYSSAIDLDPELLRPSVQDLVSRRWAALRRVGLYLLRRHGDHALALVADMLTNQQLFADVDVHHEFYGLASAFFSRIPQESRERYVELVDLVAAMETADDEPDVALRRRNWWARNRLGAVADSLAEDDRSRYDRLVGEFGREEHPDFLTYHTSWVGPTSPLSTDDVAALDPEELATTLATWNGPDTDERGPSPEGLARVLTEVVQRDPGPYAATSPRYIALDPTYARGLLFGFRQAIRAQKAFDWAPVLALCDAIVRQPTAEDEVEVDRGRDPSWRWARTEVAHLVDIGLEAEAHGIPLGERQLVGDILMTLVEDPDPTPESEVRYGPPNMDPLTYSLNATRGVAMHGLCAYAVWVRNNDDDPPAWRLTTDLPEIARILESHLTIDVDRSIAVRAVYGWWLAWLIEIDAPWVERNVHKLLGNLSTPLELAAWEAFLVRWRGHRDTYRVLATQYHLYGTLLSRHQDEPGNRISGLDPVGRFVDHLVQLRDVIPVGDGPLEAMLRAGPPWLISAIISNSGRAVHGSGAIPEDVATSLQQFWQRIRGLLELRSDPVIYQALGSFGWWFASSLPANWALQQLGWVLAHGASIDPVFLVLERLGKVSPEHPRETFEALEEIVMREAEGWALRTHEDDIRLVLASAIAVDDPMLQARTETLTHRLGGLGLHGLRDLLVW